jgi:hypothetical protein
VRLPAGTLGVPPTTPSPPPVTPRVRREPHTLLSRSTHWDSSQDTAGDSSPDRWKSHEIPTFVASVDLYRSTFSRLRNRSCGRRTRPGAYSPPVRHRHRLARLGPTRPLRNGITERTPHYCSGRAWSQPKPRRMRSRRPVKSTSNPSMSAMLPTLTSS